MSLRVVEPGLCSLIVDGGRPRTRSLGVPAGGPADRSAFRIGNALVGNSDEAAALEIALAGPVLQACCRIGAVLLGAPFSMSSARQKFIVNQSFTLEEGEELHIGGTKFGARAYLCVVGGFQNREVLGSRSFLAPLQRGDELPCSPSSTRRRTLHDFFEWPLVPALSEQLISTARVLRVLPGPEADWFPENGTEICDASNVFTVSPESNRMGLRLAGKPLQVPARELVSQPLAPGALQVTRGGQIILLGADGQSIGGYPRIAHVISADLDLVGQLRPGDRVSFQLVTLEQAEAIASQKRALLDHWCLRLREAAMAF